MSAAAGHVVVADVASSAWAAAPGLDPAALAARAVEAALAGAGVAAPVEVGVRLTDDREIRALNRKWRDRDCATNVLAFALDAGRAPAAGVTALGDVVVAFETSAAEARGDGKSLADHVSHLVVHGTLHLLGYDHARAPEADAMEALERRILATLDISDPYAHGAAARPGTVQP